MTYTLDNSQHPPSCASTTDVRHPYVNSTLLHPSFEAPTGALERMEGGMTQTKVFVRDVGWGKVLFFFFNDKGYLATFSQSPATASTPQSTRTADTASSIYLHPGMVPVLTPA